MWRSRVATTGMMIGHMLRTPRMVGSRPVLHAPHSNTGAQPAGSTALLLPPPPFRLGSFYFASAALGAGSVLSTASVPAPSSSFGASPTSFFSSAAAAGVMLKPLNTSYDRYAIADELHTPASRPPSPLRLILSELAFTPNATSGARPPPVFIGLQAAGPPRLRSTIHRKHLAHLLAAAATFALLALAIVAYTGAEAATLNDDPPSDTEMQAVPTHHGHASTMGMPVYTTGSMGGPITTGIVVAGNAAGASTGGAGAIGPAVSADGEILVVGTRVQTQHTAAYGGDGSWYAGTVLTLHVDRKATIVYDDGEEWTARFDEVYLLQGDEETPEGRAPLAHDHALPPAAPPDRAR